MKKIYKYVFVGMLSLSALSSCTNIEDYPDGRINFSDIFATDRKTGAYMNLCYNHILPQGCWYGNNVFLSAFTDDAQDANSVNNSSAAQWWNNSLTPYNDPVESGSNGGYWNNYFTGIYQCNIFLANIGKANVFSEKIRRSYTAEAHVLRAYYLLNLIKRYGGVPFSPVAYALDTDYSKVKRLSFNECAKQIIADCDTALSYSNADFGWHMGSTKDDRGKMTKAVAMAVKSQAALFAASPLWADGTISWADAANICKQAIDSCRANGYKLYTSTSEDTHNAYDTYFLQQSDVSGTSDPETIMEIKNQMNMYQTNGLPTVDGQESAGTCPTQELVDCYETKDGHRPILGYSDPEHLHPIINPEARQYNENNPYNNRDPRLEAAIYYNGARYLLNNGGSRVQCFDGAPMATDTTGLNRRFTPTGYYLRKYSNWKSNRQSNADGYFKLFRFAELLLNYAEAANEASTNGLVPNDAVDAINEVRGRVGMPKLAYGMSQEDFRARVRNERRVEFAFEEHHFYDVRRWKTLGQEGSVVTGMHSVRRGFSYRYNRFVVSDSRQALEDKFLIFPIPGDEALRMLNYTGETFQNPGW